MKPKVSVALAQINIEPLNPLFNLAKIEKTVGRIVGEGPTDLVVLPALANSGFPTEANNAQFKAAAEPGDGPFVAGLRGLAKRHGVYIAAGLLEANPGSPQTPFNSSVLIDAAGEILGWQRQVHLVGKDSDFYGQGDTIGVIPSSLGNIAFVVGADLDFPEVPRVQTLRGAEIVCCLLNRRREVQNSAEWLGLVSICRAVEDRVYFLACNRVGRHEEAVFFGSSCIAHPGGELFAQSGSEGEDVVRAELTEDFLIEERVVRPYFRDRRPENYGMICQ